MCFLGHLFQRSVNHDAAHGDCKAAEINNNCKNSDSFQFNTQTCSLSCLLLKTCKNNISAYAVFLRSRSPSPRKEHERCRSLVGKPPPPPYDLPSGGEGKANYGVALRAAAVMPETTKKNNNRQPAHQTGTAGWSRSLGAKAEKVGRR